MLDSRSGKENIHRHPLDPERLKGIELVSTPVIVLGASSVAPMLPLALSSSVPIVALAWAGGAGTSRAKLCTSASTAVYLAGPELVGTVAQDL